MGHSETFLYLLLKLPICQLDKIHFDYLVEYGIMKIAEQQKKVSRMAGQITNRLPS